MVPRVEGSSPFSHPFPRLDSRERNLLTRHVFFLPSIAVAAAVLTPSSQIDGDLFEFRVRTQPIIDGHASFLFLIPSSLPILTNCFAEQLVIRQGHSDSYAPELRCQAELPVNRRYTVDSDS